ncbi:hypothetical protein HYPSUDRAFT_197181 [Hypholoma sublateritium FD-334 SS-4]|uniref:Uncharacterized protein n=1 Tax=Hypholoma sublateritium (strain FD-334 SS-4) TaxID=945553 RepID=A0A0D2PBP1_HYPSF|nr:hypothetical protein HYPSUDRAFT_197181 [Hypholoma sublateritium FD-334 SS-4]
MSLSNSFEEAMPAFSAKSESGTATPTTAISACASTTIFSAIFGPAGSSVATAHPHAELNCLTLNQQVYNLLVANEKIIREQRNEIMNIRAELLRMQTSLLLMQASNRQANLPAAASQPRLAHGIDPDATIILPSRRQNIRRDDTISSLFDAMDIL